MYRSAWLLGLMWSVSMAVAQVREIQPQVLTMPDLEGRVTEIEVTAHFVTAIRMPEPVNSVVVGDPALFQVEHSDKEPQLVFIKALTTKPSETNLLISTTRGHEASLLVISRGESQSHSNVDFLLRYKRGEGFLVEPSGYPSALIGETLAAEQVAPAPAAGSLPSSPASAVTLASLATGDPPKAGADPPAGEARRGGLDQLLARQERAPLPALYGEHISVENPSGDHVRAGVSEVIDGGQQVIVLFSAVDPTNHNILLMPPQVQLGGKTKSGKVIKRSHWSTAEQLPVMDYRLSKRRLGPGERADGVMVFERPPYKQSNETLLLQMAEAGAVDRPALAPIGFGISTFQEDVDGTAGK
jgi:hypothetical protein